MRGLCIQMGISGGRALTTERRDQKMVAPARNGYPAAAAVITVYVQVMKKVTDRKRICIQ